MLLLSAILFHGFIDAYATGNPNQPANHQNFVSGAGTTASRANDVSLNLAEAELARDPKPIGFHLALIAGDGAEIVHSGEPHRRVYRHLYQASVSYAVGRRLLLEGGVYPSHIGYETLFSKDNWNYTRGWMGEFSPYYQTGIKVSYAWSERWSGQLHVLRGWQRIHDNNSAKSLGTQIAFNGSRLAAVFNTIAGPELDRDNRRVRLFGDWIVTYKVNARFSLAGSFDRGKQRFATLSSANWSGASLWFRYTMSHRSAMAARVERFRDPDNVVSGAPQSISEATLTYEIRPRKNLTAKIEGRRDHSTALVFAKSRNAMTNDQTLLLFGIVAAF